MINSPSFLKSILDIVMINKLHDAILELKIQNIKSPYYTNCYFQYRLGNDAS